MVDYDFRQLNDKEFEVLVTDLLGRKEGCRYERFKPGRDLGVDGRYFQSDGREVILQCKHWVSSPLEKLVKHLEDVELPKLHRLNPARYVLVLSHPLSRRDKDRIAAVAAPYIRSPTDVLGKEDLNDILAKHQDVELRHYKLWISSTTVLRYLLNKPIHDRSKFAFSEMLNDAKLYVPTANHDAAIEKLEKWGTVIITGAPGIGKTTLADHLAIHYVMQGFSFIRIAEEIREAEAVYESADKQCFYFDDFLGRNYLEALSGHEGTHIVQFIKRIIRDRRKRFILTSRTTILNQGKVLIDVFQTNKLDRNELEITMDSFLEMDRARILYNHMWHSSLAPDFVDQLYEGKRYRQIIKHRNYNPRLIRYITDVELLGDCSATEYWPLINALLDNPTKVWENPFEAQLDDFGRALVLLVTLNARAISEIDLAEAYARFVAHPDAKVQMGRRDYLLNLRHLVGSLLSRTLLSSGDSEINLFNPSIGDYVLHRYLNDLPSLRAGFCSLRSTSSVRSLENLKNNKVLDLDSAITIATQLLQTANDLDFVGFGVTYMAVLLRTLKSAIGGLDSAERNVTRAVSFILQSECPGYFADVAEIVGWALESELASPKDAAEFVAVALDNSPMSSELEALAEVLSRLESSIRDTLRPRFEQAAIEYFSEAVHDEFADEDVFSGGDPDDTFEAKMRLHELIEDRFKSLGISASYEEIECVVEAFDVKEHMREYFRQDDDHDPQRVVVASPEVDAIDDLFDRTR